MSTRGNFKVVAVQATPPYLDREATLDLAIEHVRKAGADGAQLVVFPESFVPGYPDWVWRSNPWRDSEWYARFQDQAIDVPGQALDGLRAAAEEARVWVALGITERTPSWSLYDTVVYIDNSGRIAGVHRKLGLTGGERLVWAHGTGPMLTVVDIDGVRVGSLICWEAYMPLARAALYQKGIDVLLVPTWDNSDVWVPTLRHIAKEGEVFVVGVTAFLRGSDMPRDPPRRRREVRRRRGSPVVWQHHDRGSRRPDPGRPIVGEAGTLTVDLELDRIAAGRRLFDPPATTPAPTSSASPLIRVETIDEREQRFPRWSPHS
jgi:nitrilase